jgi:hypothetical protein
VGQLTLSLTLFFDFVFLKPVARWSRSFGMQGSTVHKRQPVFSGDKAKSLAALHAPRGESGQVLDHAATGLVQVGVGSHSECPARIHQGQWPDTGACIRQEQRS